MLIGGRSRRMGAPKQLLWLEGRSFLRRAVDALAPYVDEVVALGAGPLPDDARDLRTLPDPPGLAGPLAALSALVAEAPLATWIVIACDTPLVDAEAVGWLLDAWTAHSDAWALIPRASDRPQPLFAVYGPDAAGPIAELAGSDHPAPYRLARLPGVASPEVPPEIAGRLVNVNRPEDLRALGGEILHGEA